MSQRKLTGQRRLTIFDSVITSRSLSLSVLSAVTTSRCRQIFMCNITFSLERVNSSNQWVQLYRVGYKWEDGQGNFAFTNISMKETTWHEISHPLILKLTTFLESYTADTVLFSSLKKNLALNSK